MEKWIDSKTCFSGKIFSVKTGLVVLEDGSEAQRDIVEHHGGVAVVPVIGDDVALIKQFRISIGREIVEIPAGKLENGEVPEDCARRELEEELGYRANDLILAHSYYSSVGFTNEPMHIYLAVELNESKQKPDWDERIQILKYPIREIENKLINNEFEDSKTIIGLYAMLRYLQKPDTSGKQAIK